jgi:hypothetical protein
MFEGLPELTNEVRAFRQEGMKLYFPNADYAKMGLAIFVGLFMALVLADQIKKL